MARILAVLGLVLSGCALDAEGDDRDPPSEPIAQSSASDARESPRPGLGCGPLFDENLEIVGWLCETPAVIDPGCDFVPPDVSEPMPLELPEVSGEPVQKH